MKKIILTIMLALPMLASAQKFGHINSQELFSQMPEVNQVKLKMDTINSQYENQLASMNEEIQKKYQDYQAQEATMADAIKQIRQQELQEMQQRIQLMPSTSLRLSRKNSASNKMADGYLESHYAEYEKKKAEWLKKKSKWSYGKSTNSPKTK